MLILGYVILLNLIIILDAERRDGKSDYKRDEYAVYAREIRISVIC